MLVARSGWSAPSAFSRMTSARRYSGSASAYRPMTRASSARLLRLVATPGSSGLRAVAEAAPVEGLGIAVLALRVVQHAEVVQRARDVRVVAAARALVHGQRAAVERLRLRVLALHVIELGEVVQAARDVRMVRP